MEPITHPVRDVALLFAEDEVEARDMLTRMLGLNYPGLKIYLAENGAVGLELFREFRPQLVMTDINMPLMNGIAMARQIRELEPEVTIIAVTAHSDTSYLLSAIEIGIDHYVLKPVNYEELFGVLDRVLEKIMLKRLVAELEEDRARLAAIVESSDDAIMATDQAGTITNWNAGAEKVFGYSAREMKGKPLWFLAPQERQEEMARLQQGTSDEEQVHRFDTMHVRKDGRRIYVSLTISPIRNAQGVLVGTSCIARDVTERTQMEEIIKHQAQHDTLTDLPNRKLFMDFLSLELAQARRNRRFLAVLFMDLDRFKQINDTLGHAAGDQLLQGVAQRLKRCVRESDTVARIGGDEFNVLMPDLIQSDDVGKVVGKIMGVFEAPFLLEKVEVNATTSIGISMFPEDGDSSEELVQKADSAMYVAKQTPGNSYQFYNNDINTRTLQRQKMERQLRDAVDRGELELVFQPQVRIDSGQIVAAEAFLRWRHPEQGLLLPAQFLGVAEETGAIVPIGEWVMFNACAQMKSWQDLGYRFNITVNLSNREFRQPGLLQLTSRALSETGLDPQSLELEVTEKALMDNVEFSLRNMSRITEMGVNFTVDDFGVGSSSLQTIKQLPIGRLKIDRSFIRDIAVQPNDLAVVSAVICMSHHLRMRVNAVGVESQDQLDLIRQHGCDEMQGELVSGPLPPVEFERLLAAI